MTTAETATSPLASRVLMIATYAVGFVGIFFAFMTPAFEGNNLAISAVLAVGITGILSFVRHAIYNRSDAVNGGWDYGVTNNFQIEVGLANLAWGVFAILAAVLQWGQAALAASFLISGFYFAAVTIFIAVKRDFTNRKLGGFIAILAWAVMMVWIGSAAILQA